jgi:aminoglycoside 3-N-acetyltransferase
MKTTTPADLMIHLKALGVAKGQNIVVHSNVAAFGVLEGGMAGLFKCCRDLIGPEATLAVPAYRLMAPASDVFDRLKSPSQKVGVFCEYVRQNAESFRSCNPLHSHSYNGPHAATFAGDHMRPSFGPGSDFETLVNEKFRAIYLGCNFETAGTFVFHAQACANTIPYRTWRALTRYCNLHVSNGAADEVHEYCFQYYARTAGAPRETRVGVENNLRQGKFLHEAKLAYGTSLSYDCILVHRYLTQLFQSNPLYCVPSGDGHP